jgi:hypothetical protein
MAQAFPCKKPRRRHVMRSTGIDVFDMGLLSFFVVCTQQRSTIFFLLRAYMILFPAEMMIN